MLENIIENFKFLVIETENQVKLTYGLLSDFNDELLDKIASKDDYIDNLKSTIENKCFVSIHGSKKYNKKDVNTIRAVHVICVNLERIADFCVNVARQLHYLSDNTFIHEYNYRGMFSEIQMGLSKITEVFNQRDLSSALDICRSEHNLDKLYKQNFDRVMDELRKGKEIENLITVIFIFRYLERIGDSLLNIGEALIFVIVGDRIKIRQFEALQETLSKSGFDGALTDIDFTSIWGSRSGCRIGKVDGRRTDSKAQGIFKEGSIKKIQQEEENIRKWNSIFPGLAPKIFGYYEKGNTASLLVEFLAGCTLDQIILTDSDEVISNVVFIFEQTVSEIWETTKKEGLYQTDYMNQLKTRLDTIRRVHPGFYRPKKQIESFDISSSEYLIETCEQVENELPAPFTIFIHGDFNVNNIVYNPDDQIINYIDLYRSKQSDYVQDASVFLVSNFRLPVFESTLRKRLNYMIQFFYKLFEKFAQKNNDKTFEIRMALALARSFYTSTRFELNQHFAKDMYLRSNFLMEKIIDFKGNPWESFKIPKEILLY